MFLWSYVYLEQIGEEKNENNKSIFTLEGDLAGCVVDEGSFWKYCFPRKKMFRNDRCCVCVCSCLYS